MKKKKELIVIETYWIELRYKYYNYNRTIRYETKDKMFNAFIKLSEGMKTKEIMALDGSLSQNLAFNDCIDMSAIASVSYYTKKETKCIDAKYLEE